MRKLILFLSTVFFSLSASAGAVEDEQRYDHYHEILTHSSTGIDQLTDKPEEKKILVDVLWDMITLEANSDLQDSLSTANPLGFSLDEQIRLEMLVAWPAKVNFSARLTGEIHQALHNRTLNRRSQLLLVSYSEQHNLADDVLTDIGDILSDIFTGKKGFRNKTKAEIQDLYFNNPSLENYKDGKYENTVRLFMFCRQSRRYPCLMLMKDKNNAPVVQEDGKLWHHPSLGLSKLGRPYNQTNGNTPSGVYTIDSVMPEPNKQRTYGKYRRMIINFVPRSSSEASYKKFLPESAHDKRWWKEAVVARDIGRGLLRIHGTGSITTTPRDPNHPLRPTWGCVMQREGRVSGRTYRDQRHLLDRIMHSMELPVEYSSETRILGAFYVIDLDNQRKSVNYSEIAEYLDL